MKWTPSLDREDRAALSQAGIYALLFLGLLAALLLLCVVLGVGVGLMLHAFVWAGG